jgi:hypothetical protein
MLFFNLPTCVTPPHVTFMKIFLGALLVSIATVPLFYQSYGAETDLAQIKSEITKRHDEAVKRLQDWIGQVSIAAENRGYPEGAEFMAKLARDAGFQQATVINTREYSRPWMQAHRRRSGFISCTT